MSAICDAHNKKVVVGLLYNSVHRKFNQLGIRRVGERCIRENQYPERLGPQAPGLAKKRYYGQKSGGQYVAVLFSLQLPLTHNPFK